MKNAIPVATALSLLFLGAACPEEERRQPVQEFKPKASPGQPEGPMDIVPMKSNPDSREETYTHLAVTLSAAGPFAAGGAVSVTMRITNESREAAEVVTVFTPFEKRRRSFFAVRDETGARLRPRQPAEAGPMPGPTDRRTLAPGARMEQEVDLAADFDLPAGTYTVQFKGQPLVNHLPDSAPLTVTVR